MKLHNSDFIHRWKRKSIIIVSILCLMSIPIITTAQDISGVWESNQGGTYYIRQIGDSVSWLGEASTINPDWVNVAHGTIEGSTITLNWVDVPKGQVMSGGYLTLNLDSNTKMTKVSQTGGFGCSVWTKKMM